jgi:hypothetical protein
MKASKVKACFSLEKNYNLEIKESIMKDCATLEKHLSFDILSNFYKKSDSVESKKNILATAQKMVNPKFKPYHLEQDSFSALHLVNDNLTEMKDFYTIVLEKIRKSLNLSIVSNPDLDFISSKNQILLKTFTHFEINQSFEKDGLKSIEQFLNRNKDNYSLYTIENIQDLKPQIQIRLNHLLHKNGNNYNVAYASTNEIKDSKVFSYHQVEKLNDLKDYINEHLNNSPIDITQKIRKLRLVADNTSENKIQNKM